MNWIKCPACNRVGKWTHEFLTEDGEIDYWVCQCGEEIEAK